MKKQSSICIAGGGSTFTPGIVLMLMENQERFPIRQIKLYDNNAERQNKLAEALGILMKKDIQKLPFLGQLIQKRHLRILIFVWHIFVLVYTQCVN